MLGRGMKAAEGRTEDEWMDGCPLCGIGKTEHRLKGNESQATRTTSVITNNTYVATHAKHSMQVEKPCNEHKNYTPQELRDSLHLCISAH